MVVVQLMIFCLLFFIAPLAVGGIFADSKIRRSGVVFAWVSGQILLWAVFQVICVPLILLEKSFLLVVWLYGGITILLAIGGSLMFLRKRRGTLAGQVRADKGPQTVRMKVLWLIFSLLLLAQLVAAVFLAYADGDDAYYVAVSTGTVDSEVMYTKIPYTGSYTGLDARHALAPLPIWVAYLAKVTGIAAVTMAQIVLPLGLIVMTYVIYYLIGSVLCDKKQEWLPLFMIFIAVGILFGGYSICSAEHFLLVRTAQGKAVIANIIIPFIIFLLLKILNCLENHEKVPVKYWFLVGGTMISGCLCSTLGSLLTCMFVGIVGVCAIVCYRKWKLLFPIAGCCIVPFVCAFLYFIFR